MKRIIATRLLLVEGPPFVDFCIHVGQARAGAWPDYPVGWRFSKYGGLLRHVSCRRQR